MRRPAAERFVFIAAATLLVLGIVFGAGLYSGHSKNAIYRAVLGVYDPLKELRTEWPNLTGSYPVHFLRPARYDGNGVTVNTVRDDGEKLILLSGFFGENNGVRLIRRDGSVVASWTISAQALFPDRSFCRNPPVTDWNAIPHGTVAWPDGSIALSFESCGMVRLDRCGKVLWNTAPLVTHHSPTLDDNGDIVISGGKYVDETTGNIRWPFRGSYWEDLVYRFTRDGKLTFERPVTQLFHDNDMAWLLSATGTFSTSVSGEFHLNEVEALSGAMAPAFPMFAAGDLMLSLRNRNLILVTDPEVRTVKWWRIGPWIRQHDPDFEPDGTITVFDNHTDETTKGMRAGGSRIYQVNPATNETRIVYGGTDKQHYYTAERGTHQMQPGGGVLITEAQAGRIFEVDADGNIVWEFVNRYDKDRVTWVHDAAVYPADFFKVSDWSCA